MSLVACQLDVHHKLSISRLRLLTRVLQYAPYALLYLLDEHLSHRTPFAQRIENDLNLFRSFTDLAKDLPPPHEDWAEWMRFIAETSVSYGISSWKSCIKQLQVRLLARVQDNGRHHLFHRDLIILYSDRGVRPP